MGQTKVLPGSEGIRQAYEQVLRAKKADIVCLSTEYERVIGDYFEKQYAPKLYGKVKTREILPDTAENREYARNKEVAINRVRFTTMPGSETDFIVTETMAVMISFNPESAMALVIEEPEMVKFLGQVFGKLWDRAQE